MNFRTTTAALALAVSPLAFAAPVFAGSLDVTAPEPAPVMIETAAPIGTWAGGYAGAQLGWGWADTDTSDVDSNDDGIIDSVQNTVDQIGEDGDGVLGGIHAGYLWQNQQFVYGVEGDYDFADIELDDDGGDIKGIGRLKLRAGYDLGRTLIYATGGAAYGSARLVGEDYNDWGWFAGAGVDYLVTDAVSVGAEVLYNEFDEFDDSDVDVSLTTLTARVAYRF
jgi:opacity protein-like surface antigen